MNNIKEPKSTRPIVKWVPMDCSPDGTYIPETFVSRRTGELCTRSEKDIETIRKAIMGMPIRDYGLCQRLKQSAVRPMSRRAANAF